jgi:hypothetical protein
LTKLKTIYLENNKLTAVHPRTFSNLDSLNTLDLRGNICVNKWFQPVTSLTEIESELTKCGFGYALTEQFKNSQSRNEQKFETIDRKLELLTELFYNVDERNEENAADIKEIKRTVDKIWDMLNTK